MNASISPWTPELQATVRRLFADGVITREIARQVGMSKNQIIGWLDRHDLKGRDRDYDGPTTLDRLRAHQDKMDAARWWPEFVNMVRGTIVLRYPAPLPSVNLSHSWSKDAGRSASGKPPPADGVFGGWKPAGTIRPIPPP